MSITEQQTKITDALNCSPDAPLHLMVGKLVHIMSINPRAAILNEINGLGVQIAAYEARIKMLDDALNALDN